MNQTKEVPQNLGEAKSPNELRQNFVTAKAVGWRRRQGQMADIELPQKFGSPNLGIEKGASDMLAPS